MTEGEEAAGRVTEIKLFFALRLPTKPLCDTPRSSRKIRSHPADFSAATCGAVSCSFVETRAYPISNICRNILPMILIVQYLFAMRKAACERRPGFIAKTADCAIRVAKRFIDIVNAQRGDVITYLIVSTDRQWQNRWRIRSV